MGPCQTPPPKMGLFLIFEGNFEMVGICTPRWPWHPICSTRMGLGGLFLAFETLSKSILTLGKDYSKGALEAAKILFWTSATSFNPFVNQRNTRKMFATSSAGRTCCPEPTWAMRQCVSAPKRVLVGARPPLAQATPEPGFFFGTSPPTPKRV